MSALRTVPATTGGQPGPTEGAPPINEGPPIGTDAMIEQIARLDNMHRDGTLTDEEFADLKSKVIGRGADGD